MNTTDTHLLVRRTPRERIASFPSYAQALAGYAAVTKGLEPEAALDFAVRSADDPEWALHSRNYLRVGDTKDRQLARQAENGAREWRRKEIGATATAMVNRAETGTSWHRVEGMIKESLAARGIAAESYQIERALKDRTTLGRCRRDHWSPRGCDRAYWWPKKEGSLAEHHCPVCGPTQRLAQTTLAYKRTFNRIVPQACS